MLKFISKIFRKNPPVVSESEKPVHVEQNKSIVLVVEALRNLSRGEPIDPNLRKEKLNSELSLDTLDIAVILYTLASDLDKKASDILQQSKVPYLKLAIPFDEDNKWSGFNNLCTRYEMLIEGNFKTNEVETLIRAGVVGPGDEVRNLHEVLTVDHLIEYCKKLNLISTS